MDMITPWIPEAAVSFLDSIVKPGMSVFEWGMGRSTIWFLNKGCRLISVEHDKGWYDFMTKLLAQENGKGWDPILKDPTKDEDNYQSESVPGFSFKDYVEYFWIQNKINFVKYDLFLIDGRCRNLCLDAAVFNVKPNGYIVFDNSDRDQHKKVLTALKWPRIDIFQDWQCTFFRRP